MVPAPRFTGAWPPLKLWERYPNWEHALDEEGVPGQDETTIRPADVQDHIGENVAFTLGEAVQANGLRLPAALEVIEGIPIGVSVLLDGSEGWHLRSSGREGTWSCLHFDWLPESERPPSVSLDDGRVFPLLVRSRLPLHRAGRPIGFRILSDGTTEDAG